MIFLAVARTECNAKLSGSKQPKLKSESVGGKRMPAKRENFYTAAKWEPIVGYSRAVKVGNQVFVTGTVATDDAGNAVAPGEMYAQAQQALANIEKVLKRAGASMKDVVRTRMFVTDISRWEEVGRAHGEYFRDIRPCTTMVEVSKLISPEYLVEIEADAIISTQE
jgi:enamine deaminase RidA (YjgF/YER057c/UK114 family)